MRTLRSKLLLGNKQFAYSLIFSFSLRTYRACTRWSGGRAGLPWLVGMLVMVGFGDVWVLQGLGSHVAWRTARQRVHMTNGAQVLRCMQEKGRNMQNVQCHVCRRAVSRPAGGYKRACGSQRRAWLVRQVCVVACAREPAV